ncbi:MULTISPECIES: nitrite reductase small subunit NirD [Terasakiella]|uniref:tRNA-(Guanine-N1)-methyltransferase n=1 Tax=Terasakiella brassicae TaxID=1634917 RepID=A0A917FAD9_9PROT|nr:nitrite reductase small subunit NirD [Terasakiella brassicae]GGF62103.1 tRNA-(guanine-N1)-methyltransferase [Terasakiella brassicae]
MSNWIEVGTVNDIPKLGARVVKSMRGDIAVFRTADDEIFAIVDSCPHSGGPLSQGIVHGKAVACPLHNWNIDLETGDVLDPDHGCARVIPVSSKDGIVRIYVEAEATGTHG